MGAREGGGGVLKVGPYRGKLQTLHVKKINMQINFTVSLLLVICGSGVSNFSCLKTQITYTCSFSRCLDFALMP